MKRFSELSPSAKSIYIFFVYMVISGIGFVTIPNVLVSMLGFSPVVDVWPRALGMMTILLGVYYGVMAQAESKIFFRATAYGRMSVILFFSAFVLFGFAPPTLIALGLIDLFGGIWTLAALRREATARQVGSSQAPH